MPLIKTVIIIYPMMKKRKGLVLKGKMSRRRRAIKIRIQRVNHVTRGHLVTF